MVLYSNVLLSLPPEEAVVKEITPKEVAVVAPLILTYLTVLFVASDIKRIVDALVPAFVFSIVKLFVLPVWLIRPSIITLSAPLKLIKTPATEPLIVRVPSVYK